ncbi:hypothetical protein BUALT_Bualt06G0069400 [Buddleja alternifolia]|uniref:Uncharacterized protein n=1 Tax=Buddleja alternifolia TaxID=168488 RepID=A0AAV6XDI0_9LAMI|nr:hypothetical protein BUALT_Bualt06G0069400 [Buddleja alternifolia]
MKIMADPNSLRDRLMALEARVQTTEALLGQPLKTPMVAIFQKFQDLEERIEKLGESVDEIPSFIEGKMVSLAQDLGILTDAVDMKLDAINVEISMLKRATGSTVSGNGAVQDYVNAFSSLMLDIRDMSEEDNLFNFMAGLQGWAQAELRQQGVKDLPSAFVAMDGLVDFSSETKQRSTGNGPGNTTKGNSKNQETHDEKTPTSTNKPRKGCFISGIVQSGSG